MSTDIKFSDINKEFMEKYAELKGIAEELVKRYFHWEDIDFVRVLESLKPLRNSRIEVLLPQEAYNNKISIYVDNKIYIRRGTGKGHAVEPDDVSEIIKYEDEILGVIIDEQKMYDLATLFEIRKEFNDEGRTPQISEIPFTKDTVHFFTNDGIREYKLTNIIVRNGTNSRIVTNLPSKYEPFSKITFHGVLNEKTGEVTLDLYNAHALESVNALICMLEHIDDITPVYRKELDRLLPSVNEKALEAMKVLIESIEIKKRMLQ